MVLIPEWKRFSPIELLEWDSEKTGPFLSSPDLVQQLQLSDTNVTVQMYTSFEAPLKNNVKNFDSDDITGRDMPISLSMEQAENSSKISKIKLYNDCEK